MIQTPMPRSRNILNVEITAAAARAITEIKRRSDKNSRQIVAHLLQWVSRQDEEVQRIVMGEIPASLEKAARRVAIERLTRGDDEPVIDSIGLTPPPTTAPVAPERQQPDEHADSGQGKRAGKSK